MGHIEIVTSMQSWRWWSLGENKVIIKETREVSLIIILPFNHH